MLVQWAGDDGHGVPSWDRWREESTHPVVDRLVAFQFAHEVLTRYYPDAGHICVGPPNVPTRTSFAHPVLGVRSELGGTCAANARARADSWETLIAFFSRHLTGAG